MRKTKLILLLCFVSLCNITNVAAQKLSKYIPYTNESSVIVGANINQFLEKMSLSDQANNREQNIAFWKSFLGDNHESQNLKELLFTNKYINYNDKAYFIQYSSPREDMSPYSFHLPILDYNAIDQLFDQSNNKKTQYGSYTLISTDNSNLHILYNKHQLIIVDELDIDSPIFRELTSPSTTLAKSILKKNIDKKGEDAVFVINLLNIDKSNELLKDLLPLLTEELSLAKNEPTYLVIGQSYQLGSFYWETSIVSENNSLQKELYSYIDKNKGKQLDYIEADTKFAGNIAINPDRLLKKFQSIANNNSKITDLAKFYKIVQPFAACIDKEVSISVQDVSIAGFIPNVDMKLLMHAKSNNSFEQIKTILGDEFNLKIDQLDEKLYSTSIAGIINIYIGQEKDFIYITTDKSFAKNPTKIKSNIKNSRFYTKKEDAGFTLINMGEICKMPIYKKFVENDLKPQTANMIKQLDYIKFSTSPQKTNKITVSFVDKQENSLAILMNIVTKLYLSKY